MMAANRKRPWSSLKVRGEFSNCLFNSYQGSPEFIANNCDREKMEKPADYLKDPKF
jgi:hypothetical protein